MGSLQLMYGFLFVTILKLNWCNEKDILCYVTIFVENTIPMATISATTKFDLTLTPKQFKWIDTTDWAGQSISTANVNGCFKVTAPSGIVVYDNTFDVSRFSNSNCDIHINSSLNSQQTVSLPLNISGLVESGGYIITYVVYDSNLLVYYTQTYNFNYTYVQPVVCINQVADCVSPLFTSTDTTNYVQANSTYVLTRVQTLYYPLGSAGWGAPTVTSLQTLSVSAFYNGAQQTQVTSGLVYTFSDGLIVIDSVTGVKEITVDCTYICSLSCCINQLEVTMSGYENTDEVLFEEYRQKFWSVTAYKALIWNNISCGNNNKINYYLQQINDIANCDNCNCSDTPSLVVGLGFNNIQVDVVSDSSPSLTVTPIVVGSTTTYHVALSDAFLALVNDLTGTDLVAGNNITLSSSTVGNVTTYTINGKNTTVLSDEVSNVTITNHGTTLGTTVYGVGLVHAFAYVYNTNTRTVLNGDPLPFTGNHIAYNVTHTANSTDIVVGKDGLYEITFTVLTTA